MKEYLEFYDVTRRKKFRSNNYRIEARCGGSGRQRYFAVDTSPGGTESWRIVTEAFALSIPEEQPVQKFSEELARVEPTFGPSYIISTGRWSQILKRIAGLENEIEGEREMQRKMGKENNALKDQIAALRDLTNNSLDVVVELAVALGKLKTDLKTAPLPKSPLPYQKEQGDYHSGMRG